MDANRYYFACISFYEPVAIQPIKQPDDHDSYVDDNYVIDSGVSSNSNRHNIMYSPKCLVLISGFNYIEAMKNCLGTIYTVHIDGLDICIETLIGNLLGCMEVPAAGGVPTKFSLGAGDRQTIIPPVSSAVPTTGTTVFQLFDQLGIHTVVTIFSAVMTEHKILFHSHSYSRLYNSCSALISLMYPFRYSHVYIPLLPSHLLEVLSTPTPFVIGVHSSLKNEVSDLLDVIVVDLDGGSMMVPDCIHLPQIDEHLHGQLVTQLCHVLRPGLLQADDAFPSSSQSVVPSPPSILDKEIRAIFLRFFAQILQGYRSCLQVIRIHPKPFITFHKASFLGQRNFIENEFIVRLLDCMFFDLYVTERGLPYRQCDIFDELYASMYEVLKSEAKNNELTIPHIKELAQHLHLNENPIQSNGSSFSTKVLQPTEGAFTRIHLPPFPTLNNDKVQEIIDNERIKKEMTTSKKPSTNSSLKSRIVPMGPPITALGLDDFLVASNMLVNNSARRLEVMKNCISCIFENKITDAKKTFPAVLRALKNKAARLALARELNYHVTGNNAVLEHQQFDLVVRLMNCALQQDSDSIGGTAAGLAGRSDVYGVACAILPLSMAFCRRLCTGVLQFAYTCLQDHPVWSNQSFWETTYYHDVEKDIKGLYLPMTPFLSKDISVSRDDSLEAHSSLPSGQTSRRSSISSNSGIVCVPINLEPTSLDIAAEQLRIQATLNEEQIQKYCNNEESTLFSQAIHYANRMVSLKVPLDVGQTEQPVNKGSNNGPDVGPSSDTVSNATGAGEGAGNGSDSNNRRDIDNESGFEEDKSGSNGNHFAAATQSEIGANIIKFAARFADTVCTKGGVSEDHIKALHQMIPGVIAMQMEALEAVYKESKRLPPVQKPKIVTPHLLPGEELLMQGLRSYLVGDGRDDVSAIANQQNRDAGLLPAEGAIFITNYRLIFRGRPNDPFSSDCPVVRSFPVATLTKEKRVDIPPSYLATIDQCIQEGLQLRSNTFQLIRVAFDDEVTPDFIDAFRKLINKERSPPHIFHLYSFTSQLAVPQTHLLHLQKQKKKNATLKGMAKKTLMKTAMKAGLPVKSKTMRKHKYMMPGFQSPAMNSSNALPSPSRTINSPGEYIDDMNDASSVVSDFTGAHTTLTLPASSISTTGLNQTNGPNISPHVIVHPSFHYKNDSKTLEKLAELSYVRDYFRIGLGCNRDLSVNSTSSSISSAKLTRSLGECFRITTVNATYCVAKSYPALIVAPAAISDDCIKKFSRCYRHCRFPAIIWRHSKNKALLLRSSSFHGKGVIGMLRSHGQGGQSHTAGPVSASNDSSSAHFEQEKYFRAIVNLTPSLYIKARPATIVNSSTASIPAMIFSNSNSVSSRGSNDMTSLSSPDAGTKTFAAGSSFQRMMNTLRSSGGKGSGSIGATMGRKFQKISSGVASGFGGGVKVEPRRNFYPEGELDRSSSSSITSGGSAGLSLSTGPISVSPTSQDKAALYILGEKAQIKNVKPEQYPNCKFVPIEFHEVRHVKASFKKLMRACCPSAPSSDPDQSFYRQIEKSEWLNQLQAVMKVSANIVEVIDVLGSSVNLCLEDGWDFVPLILSVVEICLDPYYRTYEGFRVLIEKEWLAFGHRFSHRLNHTASTLTSGFAPIFLQFLDIVHQIMTQFPLSFEFNQYFLKFLAYHSASCRFRTFMLDSESERAEVGWLREDAKRWTWRQNSRDEYESDDESSMSSSSGVNGTLTPNSSDNVYNYLGTSFWAYSDKIWSRSSIFYNFYYIPTNTQDYDTSLVLHPGFGHAVLKVWDYYLSEELSHGPSYDFEVVTMERQRQEEIEATCASTSTAVGSSRLSSRRVVVAGYDSVPHTQLNSLTQMLNSIKSLETELGYISQKWSVIWNKVEIPMLSTTGLGLRCGVSSSSQDSFGRHGSITSANVRNSRETKPNSLSVSKSKRSFFTSFKKV